MVAREDAQMVSGLVAQAVVVVCVEPHKYGGTTAKATRDLRNSAAPLSVRFILSTQHSQQNEGVGKPEHWSN